MRYTPPCLSKVFCGEQNAIHHEAQCEAPDGCACAISTAYVRSEGTIITILSSTLTDTCNGSVGSWYTVAKEGCGRSSFGGTVGFACCGCRSVLRRSGVLVCSSCQSGGGAVRNLALSGSSWHEDGLVAAGRLFGGRGGVDDANSLLQRALMICIGMLYNRANSRDPFAWIFVCWRTRCLGRRSLDWCFLRGCQ